MREELCRSGVQKEGFGGTSDHNSTFDIRFQFNVPIRYDEGIPSTPLIKAIDVLRIIIQGVFFFSTF
jgi:hypothetical protein